MICQQTVAVIKGQIQCCIMKLKHSSFTAKCPVDRDLHQSKFASLCQNYVPLMSFHDE